MRLAQVSSRLADLSEQYEVPEKLGRVSEKVHDGVSVASEAARKGAAMAYRAALEHAPAPSGADAPGGRAPQLGFLFLINTISRRRGVRRALE